MSEKFNKTRRRFRGSRQGKPPSNSYPPVTPFNLEISSGVARSLSHIGVPESSSFIPDPFQVEAAILTENGDVIVTAPTGSGKTWIAEQALARELERGGKAWYASPLKALSNAKYLEFGKLFGADKVGLLTGDHKANTEAPIIIGTTEILRNQLYDAMSQGRDLSTDLVVLDEAHYLGDKNRGVVWEEVLIYLPPRVRLLLLSATVANGDQLAAWLGYHRGREITVITGGERPVPLTGLCLWPSGKLEELNRKCRSRSSRGNGEHRFFQVHMSNTKIMVALRELDLLPSIFFLKSRADCDGALSSLGEAPRESKERYATRQALVDDYLDKYPFLADHRHLGKVRRGAAAAHHAGHLPHYKLMVEDLMSRGLLDVIFATSTVSAGVNFPARTVVIRQSDRFDGQNFSDLTATEFTQMTGRAGRRGRDKIGFALAVPGPHLDLGLLAGLLNSPPDPVRSSLTLSFSMCLNLLLTFRPKEIEKLLAASLATWQKVASEGHHQPRPQMLSKATEELNLSFLHHLKFLKQEGLVNKGDRLTPDGEWVTELRLDHPLVFYSGLKTQAWPLTAPTLAAAVAGITADKESNKPLPRQKPPIRLTSPLSKFVLAIGPMLDRLEDEGFDTPTFNLRPAWAMWSWSTRGDFDEAVELLGLGAGDMAMLALRTAEHLRQMASLTTVPEELTRAARDGIYRILKEPVSSPL